MKKLLFVFCLLFVLGCDAGRDEVSYSRNNQETKLTISHRNNGTSCTVVLKNAEDAKKYRERLERLVKEVEDFEKELSIREKSN